MFCFMILSINVKVILGDILFRVPGRVMCDFSRLLSHFSRMLVAFLTAGACRTLLYHDRVQGYFCRTRDWW